VLWYINTSLITQRAYFRAWVYKHECDCVWAEFRVQYTWIWMCMGWLQSMRYMSINVIIIGLILEPCILAWIWLSIGLKYDIGGWIYMNYCVKIIKSSLGKYWVEILKVLKNKVKEIISLNVSIIEMVVIALLFVIDIAIRDQLRCWLVNWSMK